MAEVVYDEGTGRYRDADTGRFTTAEGNDSAAVPDEIKSAIQQLTKQLSDLQQSQRRIESQLKRQSRDNRKRPDPTNATDRILARIDALQDIIDCPTAQQILTLTAVITLFTGVAIAGRLAFNAYQTVAQALPGVQWGESNKTTVNPPMAEGDAKIKAFLDTIAWAEGTGANYHMQFTGQISSAIDEHPEQINCSDALCSDAAGRYQFLSTTWQPVADRLGLKDFSAESQDKAAIQLLKDSGAYEKILSGDLEGAFCAAGPTWASFPCNDYSQPQKSKAELLKVYQEALNKYQSQGQSGAIASSGDGSKAMPVAGKVRVNSEFGPRTFKGSKDFHWGIDLDCAVGQPLLATQAGKIRHFSDPTGFGPYALTLTTADGTEFTYGHNSKRLTPDGATVTVGQPIAECGSEGKSTGPHLHLELRPPGATQAIDPRAYLESIGALPPRKANNVIR